MIKVRSSERHARSGTVSDQIDIRDNSLNAIRLALASLVIISHATVMTYRSTPLPGGRTVGNWAVVGFFILSGFLITRSRLTRSPRDYYLDRALRIVPALVVALIVTAFVLAPLGAAFNDGPGFTMTGIPGDTYPYDVHSAASFFVHNLPLYNPYTSQEGIGDMRFSGLSYPAWNAPLYTLFYEGLCYVGMGILVTLLARWPRLLGPTLLAAFGLLTVLDLAIKNSATAKAHVVGPVSFLIDLIPFGLAFVTGALLWIYRDRVPLGPVVALVAAVAVVVVAVVGQAESLSPLPLGLVILYLGGALPLQWLGRRFDISYGMYVYGWPVHTAMIMAVPALTLNAPIVLDIAITLVVTTVFAFLSCVVVEQPALRLKRRRPSVTKAAVPIPQRG